MVKVPCQVSRCSPMMEPWPNREEKFSLSPLCCRRPSNTHGVEMLRNRAWGIRKLYLAEEQYWFDIDVGFNASKHMEKHTHFWDSYNWISSFQLVHFVFLLRKLTENNWIWLRKTNGMYKYHTENYLLWCIVKWAFMEWYWTKLHLKMGIKLFFIWTTIIDKKKKIPTIPTLNMEYSYYFH